MLDVKHYLGIYKLRKEMMEKGITNPLPEAKKVVNEIVSKLSKMSLDEKLDLQFKDGKYIMLDSNEKIIVTFPNLGEDNTSSIK